MSQTLLGIWAHPDDEAYLSAGLMHAAARRGDRVVVITATAGEHGGDSTVWPPGRLAARRRAELERSLAALGVHEHRILGYEDGTCARHDGTTELALAIEDLDPDVIVTFGPDGMTGHPDHRAVSAWATAAHRETRSRAALWYATVTPEFHRRWGPTNHRIGLFADQPAPPSTAVEALCHHERLDDETLDAKLAALHAHSSQTAGLVELLGEPTYREWWRTESFRLAGSHPDDLDRPDVLRLRGALR